MFGNNIVSITGNVGGEPEVRHFESGTVKARFSVAVNAGKEQPPHWIPCEAWNVGAMRVQKRLHKGSRVHVCGSLKQEQWEDKETGAKRSMLMLNAETIEVIAKAPTGDETVPSDDEF